MKTIIAILLLILLSSPAFAEDKIEFRTFTNSLTCKELTTKLENPEGVSDFVLMVSSFVTGSNYAKNRVSPYDLKTMVEITEQYCRKNPEWTATAVLIALDKTIDRQISEDNKKN